MNEDLSDDEFFGDIGDPTLLFENDLTYGCNIQLTEQSLRRMCTGNSELKSLVDSYLIFKNLDFIEFVGTFGDADFQNTAVSETKESLLHLI